MVKLWLAAVLAMLAMNSAIGECLHDGATVTVRGEIAKHVLILSDGTKMTVPIIISETPICTYLDDPDQSPDKTINVTRIQLIGKNPLYETRIEIKGVLSTGNFTQYYAEQTAIKVTGGHKIEQGQSIAPAESHAKDLKRPPTQFGIPYEDEIMEIQVPFLLGDDAIKPENIKEEIIKRASDPGLVDAYKSYAILIQKIAKYVVANGNPCYAISAFNIGKSYEKAGRKITPLGLGCDDMRHKYSVLHPSDGGYAVIKVLN